VQPGEEYNKGSCLRMYNAAVRYTVDGQAGSFPIASMISWTASGTSSTSTRSGERQERLTT
jgi:hypothetical protein